MPYTGERSEAIAPAAWFVLRKPMIRLAFARLSPGCSLDVPAALVAGGPLDALLLEGGRDVVQTLTGLLPDLSRRGVKVLAALDDCQPRKAAETLGAAHPGVRIAALSGQVLDQRVAELAQAGVRLPPGTISIRALAGAPVVAAALDSGAEVVFTGGALIESLAAAVALHRYGGDAAGGSRLAGASLAGHVLACGPLACGGGAGQDWQTLPAPATIDGPIIELEPDTSFTVTRHPGSGGAVSRPSVLEALLDGIGDPRRFVTPDCRIDLTAVEVKEVAPCRVTVSGAAGLPASAGFAAVRYKAGWRVTALVVYAAPAALEKAYAADRLLRERAFLLGLKLDEIHGEFVGTGARASEVAWRAAVHCPTLASAQRAAREIDAVVRRGPPGAILPPGAGTPCVEEVCLRAFCPIPATAASVGFEVLP